MHRSPLPGLAVVRRGYRQHSTLLVGDAGRAYTAPPTVAPAAGRHVLTSTSGGLQGDGGPPAEDRLSLRRLVRAASGLSLATLLSPALSLPAGVVAARWLGPDAFGRGQAVLFFIFLAALLRTGVFEGGVRAFVHLSARGDVAGARRAQNVAITVESLVSLVPGILLLLGALAVDDRLRRTGFLLAPLAVLATSVASYVSALHVAREGFSVAARAGLVRAVVAPCALLILIPPTGGVAIVLAPMVADAVTIALLSRARPGLGLRFELSAEVARPLLRAGFPLGLAAVVYWAYRLVGSGSIALTRAPLEFGLFAFAATPVTVLARGIASLHTVLMPAVWGELADPAKTTRWVRPAARATILLALTSGALASACHAGFGPVVHVVAPGFVRSIPVLEILALNILLLSVAAVPSLVLDSAAVNRQVLHLGIWVGALILNGVANAVVLAFGAGLLAVAVNDVWVQALVVAAVYAAARPHLSMTWPGSTVIRWVAGCFVLDGLLLLAFQDVLPHPEDAGSLVVSVAARLGLAGMAWGAVALAFRRHVLLAAGEAPTSG